MRRALLATVLVATSACTASRALDALPSRQIDRPLALPDGVSSWEPALGLWLARVGETEQVLIQIPTLLQFRAGVTDELTLLYSPLPLGIQWQPIRSERHVAAASVVARFGLGLPGVNGAPQASFAYRYKLMDDLALAAGSSVTGFVPLPVGDANWDATIEGGVLVQISEAIAVSVGVSVESRGLNVAERDVLRWTWRSRGRALVVPFGAEATWSIGPQWDMALALRLNAPVGLEPTLGGHGVALRFAHFW